jgi:hypothetical protein
VSEVQLIVAADCVPKRVNEKNLNVGMCFPLIGHYGGVVRQAVRSFFRPRRTFKMVRWKAETL